jgi:uncharacterized membrane protein YjjP (DUF1212 family)
VTSNQHTGSDAAAVDFLARLGAAMVAANYPIGLVRRTITMAGNHFGLTNQMLLLPNVVQFGGDDHIGGTTVRVVHSERDLRFDQTFPLAHLVERAETGQVTPADGLEALDHIHALRPRFPAWVNVVGYAVQSAAFALILQPTPQALLAATTFGLLVGLLGLLGRLSNAVAQLLPTVSAFLVGMIAFGVGVGCTSAKRVCAPSCRQVMGVSAAELSTTPVNKFGAWAPWLGVALYAIGIMLYFGPPTRFLPWLTALLFAAYLGRFVTNVVFGSYASGFGGGFALMVFALAISLHPDTPPTAALLAPGFWLLVPGSIGLIGVTQLVGADSSDRARSSNGAAAVSRRPPARWSSTQRRADPLISPPGGGFESPVACK